VESIDRDLPVYDMRTMEDRIARSFADIRATMLLLLATAILAALLAGIAIYGSIWYAVSLRIPEIGVRLALGASPASVCLQVVGRSIALTLGGAALGGAAAFAASPMLRTLLFETQASDPLTYLGVFLAVIGLTVAASITPARRAMRLTRLRRCALSLSSPEGYEPFRFVRSRKTRPRGNRGEIAGKDPPRRHAPCQREIGARDSIAVKPIGISTARRRASASRSTSTFVPLPNPVARFTRTASPTSCVRSDTAWLKPCVPREAIRRSTCGSRIHHCAVNRSVGLPWCSGLLDSP
jgi:hypothetical protein